MTAAAESGTASSASAPSAAPELPLVLLFGNPNVGKTTLFNRLSGQNARVGNYPGITVERRVATVKLRARGDDAEPRGSADRFDLCDVPGAYSLTARSAEEQIAISCALGLNGNPRPRAAVVVVDAGQLIRNLYLVLQLVELEVPLVIALNMIDEAGENPPSAEAISKLFGVPCVATNGRAGEGTEELRRAIAQAIETAPRGRVDVDYPTALEDDVTRVLGALPEDWRSGDERRDRALALWALASIDEDDELSDIDPELRRVCVQVRADAGERDIDFEVIAKRYAFLDEKAPSLSKNADPHPPKPKTSEQVDRVLLHPLFGFVVFIGLMLVVFQSLFAWANPAITLIEQLVTWLQSLAQATLPAGFVADLVSQGIIGGVGNVIVFLPQILLLFLFIGLLEDSGYMARVAYLMDRIMKSLGLHGRAFVPMLSGFACAVPAIMATRTMERQRDRLLTMMVVPLMTCSARLPVYSLIIAALYPPTDVFGWIPVQGLLLVAMYLFSTTITLLAAAVLGRTAIRGRRIPLILELPPYRMPRFGSTLRMMWERSTVFLREAGTVILVCTVLLWGLLSFPKPPETGSSPPAQTAGEVAPASGAVAEKTAIEHSYGGRLGKFIEPGIAPLGFDWKIGVGMIGAFAAREVFVSTMAIVYGLGEVDDEAVPLREQIRAETKADGRPVYTPLVGLSLMVFFALACQCMSTLAVVRRETKSWRWPAFMFAYMTTLAYVASLAVFQIGSLLGF